MLPFPPLTHPIIQAPMAGGPSTPELAAAVSQAGGLGFLAAGYKSVEQVRADLARLRQLTARPFGLNLFVPGADTANPEALRRYVDTLAPEALRAGVALGEPRLDDDAFEAKLALAVAEQVPVVSFVFGCPTAQAVARLHTVGSAVWVTVTEPEEARRAEEAGADALIAQGVEAGGHRGCFEDADGVGELGVLALLQLLRRQTSLPLVAAGGIGTGAAVGAVLAAGATAAQLGTAFLRCPEAATSAPHRHALAQPGRTALTRAFTGRRARGIVNRFMQEHPDAPSAYPRLHHLTSPLRAAARKAGDAGAINLWAGEAYPLAEEIGAAELVRRLGADARRSLRAALDALGK